MNQPPTGLRIAQLIVSALQTAKNKGHRVPSIDWKDVGGGKFVGYCRKCGRSLLIEYSDKKWVYSGGTVGKECINPSWRRAAGAFVEKPA